ALIQEALKRRGDARAVLYVQVPDSAPAGVLSSFRDAMETFGIGAERFPPPTTLRALAKTIGALARDGRIVVLDEFQYFHRKHLREFCSLLQAEVDALTADAARAPGGLIVLGSIHTEMAALLEDRNAPLYSRTTDELAIPHLDVASLLDILREHADTSASRLLFLWTLFEGVPKFYRDCFEQGVLASDRASLLRRIFFESSSPLRYEAENWFLKELHGRYDVVLKHVAQHGGCSHGDLTAHIRAVSPETSEQVGGYLKVLIERYALIDKRLPVFAKPKAKSGRYYLADNFLQAWLGALAAPISALNFRPVEGLVADADERLRTVEGRALEKLVGTLYEERSRKRIGDFPLTRRVTGYWDSAETEIDLVALDEDSRRVRLGSCKRSPDALMADASRFEGHVGRFLDAFPKYREWTVEKVGVAPTLDAAQRRALAERAWIAEDLADLTRGL
ncbi:MAG: DUF234 domain-containing protein, partial [Candidatus Methylomirabilis sp.]|nr:DUF234 domain-containing protein [Deltaproteobacteria bacterium]